ncbi:MAG: hypothetical protein KC589_09650 [Nanoarchaeota archaeon]|nr:hypothetical protein [Nanoarchaeota archaeon]
MEVKSLVSKIKFKRNLILFLFFIIFVLLYNVFILKDSFDFLVLENDFSYNSGNLEYRILLNLEPNIDYNDNIGDEINSNINYSNNDNSGSNNYRLIVGDILGINYKSKKLIESFNSSFLENYNSSLILLNLDLNKDDLVLNENNFLDLISNDDGVVVVDNFCVKNWTSNVLEKDIYEKTYLKPGNFCFSEIESQMINYLIKYFDVNEVDFYYDSNTYLALSSNFLLYLDENGIKYNLVKIE